MLDESWLNLLDETFPGLKADILRGTALEFPWKSRPFCLKDKEETLSHVGLLDYSLSIQGEKFHVAALHAVCTQVTHRRQGLASRLIQQVLEIIDNQYDCSLLFTQTPDFYRKFAFYPVQEHRFGLTGRSGKGKRSLRPLRAPGDVPLLLRLFRERAPLSRRVWIEDRGEVAPFNALFATYPSFWSLYYSENLECVLAFELKGSELHLYDIIASKIPSWDAILDHLPAAIDKVYFYFVPDLLTDSAVPEPCRYDNGYLLVRGHWPVTQPFMIPPLSRC